MIQQFKTSTVILCIVTYAVSFSLVWLAEKWDVTTSLYRDVCSFWHLTYERLKNRSLWKSVAEGVKEEGAAPSRRVSWISAAMGTRQHTTIFQDKP